jgi:hypothetical protein
MKLVFPHIQVELSDDNRCMMIVDDYELFDWVSDHLAEECDVRVEYFSSRARPGGEIVTMYFPLSVSANVIEQCLSKLSPDDIERIYRLNN